MRPQLDHRTGAESTTHLRIQHKIQAGYALALAFLLLAGATTWWSARRNAEAFGSVERSYQVLGRFEQILVDMLDTETGQRGFVLTGDEAYLAPHLQGVDRVQRTLAKARQAIRDDPQMQRQLATLEELVAQRTERAARGIALRRANQTEAAVAHIASGQGERIMDEIRQLVAELKAAEQARLHAEAARAETAARMTVALVAAGSIAALVLVGLAGVLVRRYFQKRQQAEIALRESEENLRVTLHSIGDAVMTTDAAGRVTGLNPVAELLTGWTQAEAQGRSVDEVFHIINEETRQPAVIPVDEVLLTGEVHGLANHTVVIARDGTERPIADSAAPIRDAYGHVLGVVLVFRDVTEEKEAERAVAESERRLRILNESLEAQVQHRTAELSRSNRALRTLSEFNQILVRVASEQELLDQICRIAVEHGGYRLCRVGCVDQADGKTLRIAAGAGPASRQRELTRPEDAQDPGPVATAIRSRQPVVVAPSGTDVQPPAMPDDLSEFGVASVAALPIVVDDEALGAVLFASANATAFDAAEMALLKELTSDLAYGIATVRTRAARQAALDALHREQEFTRALLQSAADGVVACDASGTLALFNQTARAWHGMDALALPPEEWARHYALLDADGRAPLATADIPLLRAIRGETVQNLGMVIAAKGQPPRHVLASGGPFFDAQGRKLGAVISMRDITERKHAEAQRQEHLTELQRSFDALLGREDRVQELKREVNQLLKSQGEPARYPSEDT